MQHSSNEQEREGSFILKKPINQNEVVLKPKKKKKLKNSGVAIATL